MSIRLALLPLIPIPQPSVHDEFGYLLSSDTFASGRLTNPTHPMWVHFETFHEFFQPTYMTKFFPGTGLVMALGTKLLGHPWFGVWISFGLFCACLCWMLQGWAPPVYALLGTLTALGQITIFGYWMNSYWGGALAAAGGCLVIGALPRLARQAGLVHSSMAALGLVILAYTRAYEGLFLSIGTFVALLWWRRKRRRPLARLVSRRNAVPFLLIGGLGGLWLGYYNYRVTGSLRLSPYALYDRLYSLNPHFIFSPPLKPPTYRHKVMKDFYESFELAHYRRVRSNPLRQVVAVGQILPSIFLDSCFSGLPSLCCTPGASRFGFQWPSVSGFVSDWLWKYGPFRITLLPVQDCLFY